MTRPDPSPAAPSGRDGHLRLVWPQWQGAGTSSIEALTAEFPLQIARRGYAVGTAVLEAVLSPHHGPTETVPVSMSDDGLDERDGIEAKAAVVDQLAKALEIIRRYEPARITRAMLEICGSVGKGCTFPMIM
ncbi:hypothetical protein ABZ912_45620 [Nonomuraea angiospora]|uniref:hypothetical protein n=1 Tax=Nonomuraea angiospora TaxID=46172 RepID=UPI0033F2D31A